MPTDSNPSGPRRISRRTRGNGHGPITRLMSPSDLGQIVKPFVFLDLFDVDRNTMPVLADMPLHPHSGVATVTVPIEGRLLYNDPTTGSGALSYGGVEWMRAGGGVWHGKELTADDVPRIQGFQLWLSLSTELENGEPVSRYIEASEIPRVGPAHVIVGNHEGAQSPAPAPEGINYLLVRLPAGERWMYRPPMGHTVGWLALAKGTLEVGATVEAGEMIIFEPGETPIDIEAGGAEETVFVIGSAVPHPYPLHLGYYSVHTSSQALEAGERRIAELGRMLSEAGNRRTAAGTLPVFR
ncbi:Pirin-related protein [plant metagenome]|uniref:Pirin-related protein n=1 Tax=plant metagenome TaxID=1297885 RepID=A0A484Q3A2_9ZZZZ